MSNLKKTEHPTRLIFLAANVSTERIKRELGGNYTTGHIAKVLTGGAKSNNKIDPLLYKLADLYVPIALKNIESRATKIQKVQKEEPACVTI